jgi:hypothetical protein
MGHKLSDFSQNTARRILAQMQAEDAAKLRPLIVEHGNGFRQPVSPDPRTFDPRKPTLLRQKTKGPNKLETAFAAVLRAENPGVQIREQAVTWQIGNGVRYTPDIMIVEPGRLEAYETKGGLFRDDAKVKIKVAASIWPQITFFLVWRKAGVWHRQRILA